MPLILNIDTALESGYVSLSSKGTVLSERRNDVSGNHASFLHTAIEGLFHDTGIEKDELSAVALSAGPGSYTGLRIGMSAAKGLCYALRKPLICINTLELLAADVLEQLSQEDTASPFFICPMIDARRMDVFTAVFNPCLNIDFAPQAVVIDDFFMQQFLSSATVYFTGSGAVKWKKLSKSTRSVFCLKPYNCQIINKIGYNYFLAGRFEKNPGTEPFYCKPVYTHPVS